MRIVPPNSTATGEEAPAEAGEAAPIEPSPVVNTVAPTTTETSVAAPPPDYSNLVGTVLADRYRLIKRIGEGGMGSVYQAEHITIGRKLAIKVLSPEYGDSPEIIARFLQEARTASMLHHEHIVDITDFGYTKQGLAFLTMEYLEGEDLATMLAREGRQPWTRVRRILLQICRALDAAHEAGIVHRDMKPDNCFRIKRGGNPDFIKILDFGIAKVIVDGTASGRAERQKMATEAGTLLGTPEYMAPEIARDQKPDARVDVYSVGVVMYELLTGSVPFKGQTFMATVAMQMVDEPEPPRKRAPDAGIPESIEKIVLHALRKDPAERFQTIREFADAIIEADRALRYTQNVGPLSWEPDEFGVQGSSDDVLTTESTARPLPDGPRHPTPRHAHPTPGHATPPPRKSPTGSVAARMPPEPAPPPLPVIPTEVDDEPSNFSARPNPYRALAGLLLLVVVGLGGLVYYLLNREPEATEPPDPIATIVIPGATPDASGTGDVPRAPDDEKKDDEKKDDEKKDDEPKKKPHKPDDDEKPHKKSPPQNLVQSTDEERKEFFGALASDVRRCASQHEAAKELVRVAVNVEAGSGKLDAQLRSHKDNAAFGDCVVKAFEKRRFKKGKQAFVYNSDYQI
ncbi:serine/threonine protein kinase [Nannocystis exedens]|uniref:Serine/threonine protein kinase n=1 Tax=Nannocystis exedens TaxID=54 RepID=A0A1I2BPA3_9BACT|nr:serine/threonine-protein kinase [Nannocystis exedens]PCC67903.1 Serine/threonine-protein kinase Pkn1 [Nannocystis exedens]SFE57080.1 serine/threonine protein kinase [Nannocystis exedens]